MDNDLSVNMIRVRIEKETVMFYNSVVKMNI
jgi:hypothetical protein